MIKSLDKAIHKNQISKRTIQIRLFYFKNLNQRILEKTIQTLNNSDRRESISEMSIKIRTQIKIHKKEYYTCMVTAGPLNSTSSDQPMTFLVYLLAEGMSLD
jgi:poly-D-alanine transfer protein DltD